MTFTLASTSGIMSAVESTMIFTLIKIFYFSPSLQMVCKFPAISARTR